MEQKYWLRKRGNVFYSFDSATGKRESLQTSDKEEAARILHAKNDAPRHAAITSPSPKALEKRFKRQTVRTNRGPLHGNRSRPCLQDQATAWLAKPSATSSTTNAVIESDGD